MKTGKVLQVLNGGEQPCRPNHDDLDWVMDFDGGAAAEEIIGWRREHAHRVWNAAASLLTILAVDRLAYCYGLRVADTCAERERAGGREWSWP